MSGLQCVMLVEDDLDIAELARIGLEDLGGFEFIHFNTGAEALQGLEAAKPDFILLDYRMPGMNGAEVLREIRSRHGFSDKPIAFMTASVMPQHVERLRELGAADVIAKPFDPLTLADTVRAIYHRACTTEGSPS
jgi:CheY-like chemotaxis protein